jgi:hypothetical protein
MFVNRGSNMPDQYNKLVGNTLKYPYLVGITTESENLGTGILVSGSFVLTCGHVLGDSTSVEVISRAGRMSARTLKIDESLDLALLELMQPISASKAKFADVTFQPDRVLLGVGVQASPGKSDELAVAEIQLKYRNKNDADGKILDIQLEGGARPGYSGGPVVVEKGGTLVCVGVMRYGGAGSNTTNAIGLGSIRAFLADYIPDMPEDKVGRNGVSIRRPLILSAILLGVVVAGGIAKWLYPASQNPKATSGAVVTAPQGQEKPTSGHPAPVNSPPPAISQSPGTQPQTLPAPPTVHQGSSDVMVWVNTASSVYHCQGTRWYGKTKHGEYMTQEEAQKKANRPANGKLCKETDH